MTPPSVPDIDFHQIRPYGSPATRSAAFEEIVSLIIKDGIPGLIDWPAGVIYHRFGNPDGGREGGQRRTLAAIQTQRPTVPVVVFSAAPGAELDRIIEQWHENEHRTGLSVADQATAVQQLTVFGLNAEQISQQLRAPKPRIEQALKVGGSELATKAADRYDLTLDQAAVLSEFENDKGSLTMLIAAAKEGPVRFADAAQTARDARELAKLLAEATAKLEKAKARILTREQARGTTKLDDLTASEDRKPITPAQHKRCPGHAAYIYDNWQGVHTVFVCTDAAKHGHRSRYGNAPAPATLTEDEADALTEQAREERRRVITNNRAWASAETVRRQWLKTFLARKSPDKGSTAFLAGELILGRYEIRRALERGSRLLCELLGYKDRDPLKAIAATATGGTDARALVLALAVVLAALEEDITREAWRRPTEANKRYLAFLTQHGYQPSDVEQLVLGQKEPRRKTSRTAPANKAAATATPASERAADGNSDQAPATTEDAA